MDADTVPRRPAALRLGRLAATAALALAFALNACAHGPYVSAGLASVEVFDRNESRTLETYAREGRRYIVGTPGHEYTVRIRNLTGGRILVVTSVDGVNVISGDTASPGQSGYVLDPYGSVDIAGWRKSLERTAAFYFTDLSDSYAARTGRPDNVGVIGVAVFRERERVVRPFHPWRDRIASGAEGGKRAAEADSPESAAAGPMPAPSFEEGAANGAVSADARKEAARQGAQSSLMDRSFAPKLGTGHGRSESSQSQIVRFERASPDPAETIAIRYDRRENLIALGVIPGPRYAERAPNPFPGMRFAPDPR